MTTVAPLLAMSSSRSVFIVSTLAVAARAASLFSTAPSLLGCLSQEPVYSCENTTAIANTCCSPTPGGLVLQTQFWSTYTGLEAEGQLLPEQSWTIHGLWPDNCDGSYESYCDLTRQYDPVPSPANLSDGTVVPAYEGPGVDKFVAEFGRFDQLDFMNKYWINQKYPNIDLWAHEFSKHATCTSTFDVACYGENYTEHADVVNFFDATIRAFAQYPTYDMLAAYGIVPSNTTTYSLDQITSALKSQTGAVPFLGCQNKTALTEVWYFSHVYGTEQYGTYKTLNSTTNTTCSHTEGIWYYERSAGSEHDVRSL